MMTFFLQEVDKELDMMHQGDYIVMSELDTISTPTDEQAQLLSNKAKLQANRMKKKMEKISIAPGEEGRFQNWGEDIFLEEKMFPEKFPYGTGGYLSQCTDNPEKN